MMVAIKARDVKELMQICKEHRIGIRQATVEWWTLAWKGTDYYLCISVENGEQRGGGHVCTESELGNTVVLTTRRRLI